jgi:hypothetical protein
VRAGRDACPRRPTRDPGREPHRVACAYDRTLGRIAAHPGCADAGDGALGSRYVLQPGLAELSQALVDQFEVAGLKIVRTRLSTLRLSQWVSERR